MANDYTHALKFYDELKSLCKPDMYNLVLHKHLGDVFYAIGAKDEFENTYNAKLHFIVRPQHEFLMEMWGYRDYSVFDITAYEKEIKETEFPYMPPAAHESHPFEMMCKDLFPSVPIKGIPFIADGDTSNFFLYDNFWGRFWLYTMGLNMDNFRFSIPKYSPTLSADAQEALKEVASLDKIVLFAPEAATAAEFSCEFWNIIAECIHAHGYKIIVNSKKYKIAHGISAFDFNLSLSDVVALGLSCAYVFSLRSGLCDVLVGIGEKLYAFYSAVLHREMNGLNKCFEPRTGVNEISVWRWKINKVVWEGEDLTKSLQRHINKLHRTYTAIQVKYILTYLSHGRRNRYKLCYHLLRDLAGEGGRYMENNMENPSCLYRSRKLSFLGIPVYESKYKKERQGRIATIHKLFGGLLKLELYGGMQVRLFVFGKAVFFHGEGKFRILKIDIHRPGYTKKWLNRIQDSIDKKYDAIYIIRHNIGESYVELMHLGDTIKADQSMKPLLILWDKKYAGFYKMFLPQSMDMRYVDLQQNYIHAIFENEIIEHNNCRFICRTPLIAQKMKAMVTEWPDVNFYDYINKAAGIKKGTKPALPKPSEQAVRSVGIKIRRGELGGRFVILCPEASSLMELEDKFWESLAEGLRKKGYCLYVNIWDTDMALKNTKTARMTEELFVLAGHSTGIITLGSGLSVLLTASGVKMDILYTDFKTKDIGYNSALAMQIYSVHHLPGVSKDLVREYDTNKINSEELIHTIMERY